MNWAFLLIFILSILAVTYVIASYQLGHKVAFKRLPIMAAVIGISALLWWFLQLLPTEWEDYAWSGLSFGGWIALAISVKRAAHAGDILLEIGRPRGSLLGVVGGAGLVLVSVIDLILLAVGTSEADAATQFRQLSENLFFLSFGIYLLYVYLSKWPIRERGIMVYGQLLPWEKIEGFRWEKDPPSTLALSVKRRLPLWRTVHLRIRSDRREAVSEVLERKLSANAKAAG